MPDMKLDDVTIHYEEVGSGPLAYVFCPGLGGDGQGFVEHFPFWQQHFPRVLTWDNREHRHAGIGLLMPEMVLTGQAAAVVSARRQQVLSRAYASHQERFSAHTQADRDRGGDTLISSDKCLIHIDRFRSALHDIKMVIGNLCIAS